MDCIAGLQRDGADWQGLFGLLRRNNLGPLAYYKLRQFDLLNEVPGEMAGSLHETFRANQIRNHVLRREALALFSGLGQQGISAVVLKGATALFQGIYAHPANRGMTDMDFSFNLQDRAAVTAVLREMGYRCAESGRPYKDVFVHPVKDTAIETHYRLFDVYVSKKDAGSLKRKFRQGIVRLADPPHPVFTLSPEDLLFFHIYHAFVQHREWLYESLQAVVDFVYLDRFYGNGISLDRLLSEARRAGLDQFFLSFLYIVGKKTGWGRGGALPVSKNLRRSLDLYLQMESQYPSLHGLHVRRLILGGFEEKTHQRLRRLVETMALDMETVGSRYGLSFRRFFSSPPASHKPPG